MKTMVLAVLFSVINLFHSCAMEIKNVKQYSFVGIIKPCIPLEMLTFIKCLPDKRIVVFDKSMDGCLINLCNSSEQIQLRKAFQTSTWSITNAFFDKEKKHLITYSSQASNHNPLYIYPITRSPLHNDQAGEAFCEQEWLSFQFYIQQASNAELLIHNIKTSEQSELSIAYLNDQYIKPEICMKHTDFMGEDKKNTEEMLIDYKTMVAQNIPCPVPQNELEIDQKPLSPVFCFHATNDGKLYCGHLKGIISLWEEVK